VPSRWPRWRKRQRWLPRQAIKGCEYAPGEDAHASESDRDIGMDQLDSQERLTVSTPIYASEAQAAKP